MKSRTGPAPAAAPPPRISVCIPTYRRLSMLLEAVASVRGNGYERFEIVVSDDDADPRVERALRALRDPRVRYLPHARCGIQANWTHAVRAARARYVMKLDDDDLLLPGFLAATVAYLDAHPGAGIVFTAHQSTAPGGRFGIRVDRGFWAGRDRAEGFEYARALLCNEAHPINHKSAGVFRKSVARRLGFYDKLGADVFFTIGMASLEDVGYLETPLFHYRHHDGTRQGMSVSDLELCFRSLDALFRFPWIAADGGWTAIRPRAERTQRLVVPLMYVGDTRRKLGIAAGRRLAREIVAAHPEVGTNRAFRFGLVALWLLPPFLHDRVLGYYSRSRLLKRLLNLFGG